MKEQMKQAVIFPEDVELKKLRKENKLLKRCVKDISKIDYLNTPKELYLLRLQDAVIMAETTLDDLED